MTLGDFLRALARHRGPWNCSTAPADWCIARGHPDYAVSWRGITDPAECDAIAGGDLLSLWDTGIGDALPVVTAPFEAGDIGVVTRAGLQAGAIYTGERWVLQAAKGFVALPFPASAVMKAWRP